MNKIVKTSKLGMKIITEMEGEEWPTIEADEAMEAMDKYELQNTVYSLRYGYKMLQKEIKGNESQISTHKERIAELENGNEILEDKIYQALQWTKAYPQKAFKELTTDEWNKSRNALIECGVLLDRISASNMRHVLNGIAEILNKDKEKE